MCKHHEYLSEIAIQVDVSGTPVGARVVRHFQSDHETSQPITVGPFDTREDVLDRCRRALDLQLTLW